ncbi:holliday junction resolvasome, DNA-binding subunit, partial [Saprospira grandis DSM 2844]
QLFEQLISVSGVGANTARVLLSAMSAKEIRGAIIAENVAVLKSAKGIGPKSAKRIILELKDKLLKESGAVSEAIAASIQGQTVGENPIRSEALDALLALGFNKIKAQKVLNKILKTEPEMQDVGQLIKLALAQMT